MVEFVRDVIIAVAVLAALIAVAAQPGPDAGSVHDGKSSATAGGTRLAAAGSPQRRGC